MIRKSAFLLLLLATAIVGCKEDPPVPVETQRSYLHILGGANIAAFDVKLDYFGADDVVIDSFYYQRNFPLEGYANLTATRTPDEFGNGEMMISATRTTFLGLPEDTIMQPQVLELVADESATLCFADSMGKLVTLKITDNINIADPSMAYVRFINLAPDQSTASIATQDGSYAQNGVGFLQFTDFSTMASGQQVIDVADSSGTNVNTMSAYFYGGKAYTFYLSGSGNGNLSSFVH